MTERTAESTSSCSANPDYNSAQNSPAQHTADFRWRAGGNTRTGRRATTLCNEWVGSLEVNVR